MQIKGMLVYLILLFLFGCVSTEYAPIERNSNHSLPYDVRVGESVRVITGSGESIEFEVTNIGENSIFGDGVEISFQDIRILQRQKVDMPTTVASTGVGALTVALAVGAVLLAVAL